MATSNRRRHSQGWYRRKYHLIDLQMSDKVRNVLIKLCWISGGSFALLCVLGILWTWLGPRGWMDPEAWMPWNVFVQLTNPAAPNVSQWADLVDIMLMVLTNLVGIFLVNGLLLTFLVNWVSERRERFAKGEARYANVKDCRFSVIIGGHPMAAQIAHRLLVDEGDEYVIIQTKRPADKLRKDIYAEIADEDLIKDILIYAGDRSSWHELAELNLQCAREVYLIGETSAYDGTNHDAINMHCWQLICENIKCVPNEDDRGDGNITVKDKKDLIPCHVMFEYQSTYNAFQFTDVTSGDSHIFDLIPFSVYESWAQQLLIAHDNKDKEPYYLPLEGMSGINYDSRQRVHLIIVGMSKMGVALAVEAAHLAHYPNFNNPEAGHPRTLITMIDRNAQTEMYYFTGRFRELFKIARWRYIKAPTSPVVAGDPIFKLYDTSSDINNPSINNIYPWQKPLLQADENSPYSAAILGENLVDIDFEFIQGDVSLPAIQHYIAQACADRSLHDDVPASRTTIAVCVPDSPEALSTVLYFEPSVYNDVQQIWVQQSETGAVIDALSKGYTGQHEARFKNLRAFGMADKCDYMSILRNPLSKYVALVYEIGAANFKKMYDSKPEEVECQAVENWKSLDSSGGKSLISKRWSNTYSANSFLSKMRCAGIDWRNPEDDFSWESDVAMQLAATEHNRWVVEQLLLGVRPLDKSMAYLFNNMSDDIRDKLKSANIHPDIVDVARLPLTSLKYDRNIASIIPLALRIVSQKN